MNAEKIPNIIITRLPVYLRALQRMADNGLKTTSSQEMGDRVGISAAQIRKALPKRDRMATNASNLHSLFLKSLQSANL